MYAYIMFSVTVNKVTRFGNRSTTKAVQLTMQDGTPPLVSVDSSTIPTKVSRSDVALRLVGDVEWQLSSNIKDDTDILGCPNMARNCLYWVLDGDSDVAEADAFALSSKPNSKNTEEGYFYESMVISLASLTPGASYTFHLIAVEAGKSGFAKILLTMNIFTITS